MFFLIQGVFFVQFMIFSNIRNSHEYLTCDYMTQSCNIGQLHEAWIGSKTPSQAEDKKEWAKWIANKKNQSKFLQKIKSQVIEGGLDSSEEISSMLLELENALLAWNKTVGPKSAKVLKKSVKQCFEYYNCTDKLIGSAITEDNDIEQRIQDLREEEEAHKAAAFDLITRAGEEVMSAGAFAVSGMNIPAIIMGGKASYDFIEGCKEYNKGVKYEEEAYALNEKNTDSEDTDEEKSWWQFWK